MILHSTQESETDVVKQIVKPIDDSVQTIDNVRELEIEDNNIEEQTNSNNIRNLRCTLCKSGSLPSKNGAHKCVICTKQVHALPECSAHKSDDDEIRICYNCFEKNEKLIEDKATDEWNRKGKKQIKSTSYLLPNAH